MKPKHILLLVLSVVSTTATTTTATATTATTTATTTTTTASRSCRALADATAAEIEQSLNYCLRDNLAWNETDRMPTITLTADLIADVKAALQSEPKCDVTKKLAGVLQRIRGGASDYQNHDQSRMWTEKFARRFSSNLVYRMNNQGSYRLGGAGAGRSSRRPHWAFNHFVLGVLVLAVWAFNHFAPDMAGDLSDIAPKLPTTSGVSGVSGSRPTGARRVRTISDWYGEEAGEPYQSEIVRSSGAYVYAMTGRR